MSDSIMVEVDSDIAVDASLPRKSSSAPDSGDDDRSASPVDSEASIHSGDTDDEFPREDLLDDDDLELVYVWENGRRYANEDCFFPNDDEEVTRLSITHQVYLLLRRGSLTVSRIHDDIRRILDIGTGAGDWAIAMGEAHPQAKIIATDIAAYQPTNAPPNVEFRIEDASMDWTYDEPFDFIHLRDMVLGLPDFMHLYRQVAKFLTPSGTLEFATSGPLLLKNKYEGSALQQWNDALRQAMQSAGVAYWLDYKDKKTFEKSGLISLKHSHTELRLGDWTKDPHERSLGRMALVACCESIETASLRAFTKHLGWTAEHAKGLSARVVAELMDLRNEPYVEVDCIIAKRMPSMD